MPFALTPDMVLRGLAPPLPEELTTTLRPPPPVLAVPPSTPTIAGDNHAVAHAPATQPNDHATDGSGSGLGDGAVGSTQLRYTYAYDFPDDSSQTTLLYTDDGLEHDVDSNYADFANPLHPYNAFPNESAIREQDADTSESSGNLPPVPALRHPHLNSKYGDYSEVSAVALPHHRLPDDPVACQRDAAAPMADHTLAYHPMDIHTSSIPRAAFHPHTQPQPHSRRSHSQNSLAHTQLQSLPTSSSNVVASSSVSADPVARPQPQTLQDLAYILARGLYAAYTRRPVNVSTVARLAARITETFASYSAFAASAQPPRSQEERTTVAKAVRVAHDVQAAIVAALCHLQETMHNGPAVQTLTLKQVAPAYPSPDPSPILYAAASAARVYSQPAVSPAIDCSSPAALRPPPSGQASPSSFGVAAPTMQSPPRSQSAQLHGCMPPSQFSMNLSAAYNSTSMPDSRSRCPPQRSVAGTSSAYMLQSVEHSGQLLNAWNPVELLEADKIVPPVVGNARQTAGDRRVARALADAAFNAEVIFEQSRGTSDPRLEVPEPGFANLGPLDEVLEHEVDRLAKRLKVSHTERWKITPTRVKQAEPFTCPWPDCNAEITNGTIDEINRHIRFTCFGKLEGIQSQFYHESHKVICRVPGCGKRMAYKAMARHIAGVHLTSTAVRCPWPGCGKVLSREGNFAGHYVGHIGSQAPTRKAKSKTKSKGKQKQKDAI